MVQGELNSFKLSPAETAAYCNIWHSSTEGGAEKMAMAVSLALLATLAQVCMNELME